jgi:REP element-mobilizing transposase RayT
MDVAAPELQISAKSAMVGPPVTLEPQHAAELFSQFRETATHRGWVLLAIAILSNHVHLVVRVAGDPDGSVILRDFKSYASRRLNRVFSVPPNGSWWAESGSRRVLKTDFNICRAIEYVRHQAGALLVWIDRPIAPLAG